MCLRSATDQLVDVSPGVANPFDAFNPLAVAYLKCARLQFLIILH